MDGSISESPSTIRSLPQCILSDLQQATTTTTNSQTSSSTGLSAQASGGGSSSSSVSAPSSPRSSALPSPPDSPFSGSVSSLPSVGSSFFFSSAAASPGRLSQPLSDRDRELVFPDRERGRHRSSSQEAAAATTATQGLIIPSLTLPPAVRPPTPYGQTLGEVRLLVLGRQGAGKSFLTGLLLEDNEEVVEVGTWEDPVSEEEEELEDGDEDMILLAMLGAKVLRASTDWVEHSDRHGLEKFEPTKNVEIVELPGYDPLTDGEALVANLKNVILAPFHTLADVLHPDSQPSSIIANLVSSASTPLFTALILLLPSATMTTLDRLIVDSLGTYIPIIVLSTPSSPSPMSAASSLSSFSRPDSPTHFSSTLHPAHSHPTLHSSFLSASGAPHSRLSAFRPFNAVGLKNGLFRSPEVIAMLRMEAAERFLRWREVERAVVGILGERSASGAVLRKRRREVEELIDQAPPRSMQAVATTSGSRSRERGRTRAMSGSRSRSRSRSRSLSRSKGMKARRTWEKESWEREWMENFSRDVGLRLRADTGDTVRPAGVGSDGVEQNQASSCVADEGKDGDEDGEAGEGDDEDELEDEDEGREEQRNPRPPLSRSRSRSSLSSSLHDDDASAVAERDDDDEEFNDPSASCHQALYPHIPPLDPLHLPSLILLTVSMLGPLKARIAHAVKSTALGYWEREEQPSAPAVPVPYYRSGNRGRGRARQRQRQRSGSAGSADVGLEPAPAPSTTSAKSETASEAGGVEGWHFRWVVMGGLVGLCVGVGVGTALGAAAAANAS